MLEHPQSSTIIFGFDSAWTDSPGAPGAICAIAFDAQGKADFHEPRLVSFSQALEFIDSKRHGYAVSLVALDQPTIVPNATGSRPVDKVAGSLISFIGGGVQPASRSKRGMFCDDAPVWRFLTSLNAAQEPIAAQSAAQGHFIVEVFPALALSALHPQFAERHGAPKYNPKNRRKYRSQDWQAVAHITASTAERLGVVGLAAWAESMADLPDPRKADQDKLDASICALVGLIWRAGAAASSAMLGDLMSGYMVTPVSDATSKRLEAAALKRGTPFVTPNRCFEPAAPRTRAAAQTTERC